MNKPVPNTPLGHASIHALKNMVLDKGSTDSIESIDLVRMFFGIQNEKPAQVEIMSNVINAVGGMRDTLVAALRNKFAEGALWEFTTDFGVSMTLSKIQHKDGVNPLRLTITQKTASGVEDKRPLVEFTGGQCKFFDASERETPVAEEPKHEKFSFTTDTVKKESNEPVQTVPEETQAEAQPEPATETLQNESNPQAEAGETVPPESGGLTSVESLETTAEPEPAQEQNTYIPTDTPVRVDGSVKVRVLNKVLNAANKIVESGKATLELIDELIRPNIPKYNIEVSMKDGNVYILLSDKPAEPPSPTPEPAPEVDPKQAEAEQKVAADLETLMNAEKNLREEFEKCNAYDQMKLLKEFQTKITAIDPVVRKELFSKNYPDVATSLATCFRDLTIRAKENLEARIANDKAKVEEEIAQQDADAAAEQAEQEVQQETLEPLSVKVTSTDLTNEEMDAVTEKLHAIFEGFSDGMRSNSDIQMEAARRSVEAVIGSRIIEFGLVGTYDAESHTFALTLTNLESVRKANSAVKEPTQENKENKEMTVRIDCPAAIPDEDYKKITERIKELCSDPSGGYTDDGLSKLVTADIGYECHVTRVNDDEFVVSIPIEDDGETSEEEQLQEAMNSDKGGEKQWLDLSDAAVREPFIQILFPGISYPSYMHLMTFLKKFHTEEQTKTFIATKGSIPTETTIVYDNVTFCIVKMKESRFYRIFIANTDYSLKDHGWCETNYVPNRWFRLGQDIHNPCFQNEGIIENRGGFHRGYGR